MDKLIFLSNSLINPDVYKEMHLPLEFIRFGIIDGRMYRHYSNQGTFVLPINALKRWGNSVVYGGIFLLKDFDYYIRILDAYHACSMSTLFKNHPLDIHHRLCVNVTPINFFSISDLQRLKYEEGESHVIDTYFGNLQHPKIKCRLHRITSSRIIDGINATDFLKLYREVTLGKSN